MLKLPPFSFKKLLDFVREYGKHISTGLFVFGFILDFLYLPEVDHPLTPYIGIFYLSGLSLTLFARSILLTKSRGDVYTNKLSSVLSLFFAFFSGSVLSYIFVMYYRSSYIAGAFPFFLFALFVIFANEYIQTKKYRTYLDISILFFVITALSIFIIPFIFHSVSGPVFAFSLCVALALSLSFSFLLFRTITQAFLQKKIVYALALWAPLAFAFLYYTDSVPPLPLSITSAGIYHSVQKTGSVYQLTEEVREGVSTTVHNKEGRPLYFFTTIFAPSHLSAPINHLWEKYNEDKGVWELVTKVSYPLVGGRKEGYRGYTLSRETAPGKWRISVYLDGKRLLGRHYFTLVSEDPKTLRTITK